MAYDGSINIDSSMDASGFQKDLNRLGDFVKGLSVFKIIEQGFQAITASIDNAVSRYDTLNRFPKIMEQMGFSTDEADTAVRRLSDGVQGLPTALDAIVSSAQRIASMTGDLVSAADLAIALNNAFLASGASTDAASRGMEQYMQIVSRGKPEMQDWKTLQETMPYALQEVAKSFGFAGTSATRDFYSALQNGEITVEQMNTRFIELSTAVGGFADTAKTATGGIGTAWQNLKTGMVRGVANIVESIDTGFSHTRFVSIQNVIQNTSKSIEAGLGAVAKAFGYAAENAEIILPTVVNIGAAFIAWKIGGVLTSIAGGFQTAALQVTLYAMSVKGAITADAIQTAGLTTKEVLMGVLRGSISKATAAQWAWNTAMTANPIGVITVGVVALIGSLTTLVICLNKSTGAYEEQKKEIEDLAKTHEEYKTQLEEDQKTAEQAISKTKAQTEANSDLVDTLRDLISTNNEAGANNSAITQTVDQLNNAIEGLGLTYNETTGALNNNIEELSKYVDAHGQLSNIQAQEEEYNRLLNEQLDLQSKIRVEGERKISFAHQLESGRISVSEYNDLIRKTDNLIAEYSETEQQLASDIQSAHSAIDKTAKRSAKAQINAFKAVNGEVDANGRNLKQLALLYGITTDQILSEMREQELSMTAWSEKKAAMFTKDGQSLQGIANQWGMTTDEVNTYMDEWGMNLDEFAQHMEDTHTKEGLSLEDLAAKWGTTAEAIKIEQDNMGISLQEWSDKQDKAWADYEETIKNRTSGVVNSFKEIPSKFEQSAQEMLEVLISNKERYAEWESTMENITKQLGSTAAEEFRKLGPEATSAMQEILSSTELLNNYREVFGVKVDEVTGMVIEDWKNPSFIGAPSTAIDLSAKQVEGNSTLSTAVTEQMKNAKEATETVDFTAVGQNIIKKITNGLNNVNMSDAMNTIASTMQNGAGVITSTTATMSTSVQSILQTMSNQCESIANKMMSQINSAIMLQTPSINASTASLTNGVVLALEPLVNGGKSATDRMMDGMLMALTNKAGSLYTKAREIANEVAATLRFAWDEHSPSRVSYKIMAFFMQAMYNAMGDMSGMLYKKADSVAAGLTDRFTVEPDLFSNITDKLVSITEGTILGGAALVPHMPYAGSGGGTSYVTNLTQNITTPKPLSASEMTREGQDLLRRSRWQLP